jgi:phenylacetate-CoA ligase
VEVSVPLPFRLIQLVQRRSTLQLLSERVSSQWLGHDEIEHRQLERPQALVSHVYAKVPYYRELLETPDTPGAAIESLADFSENVPLMSKGELRGNLSRLHAENLNQRLIIHSTSGSTGQPLRFPRDTTSVSAGWADRLLTRSWWGVGIGDGEATIWGHAIKPRGRLDGLLQRLKDELKGRAMRTTALSAYGMSAAAMRRFAAAVGKVRPSCLYGYVSALERFARFLRDEDVALQLSERAIVIATAEALTEPQRQLLREVYRRPIVNEYGSCEAGMIAFECPEGGFHLLEDTSYVEIVDDRGQPTTGTGEVVLTSLFNFSVPLIRYQMGDLARISTDPCRCGRGGRLLASIEGRKWGSLRGATGRTVTPFLLSRLMQETPEVQRFQAVQDALDLVKIRLVYEREPAREDLDAVRRRLSSELGEGTRIEFERVRDLEAEASGKYLAIKQRMR